MSKIKNNHLLVSYTSELGTFDHFDENGILLETITVPGGVAGWRISSFSQYHGSTYMVVRNNNVSPIGIHIMEYDQNLNYVRTVFNGIDASDAAQNPTGLSQLFLEAWFIGLDSQGNIYLDIDTSSNWLWKYDNNGNFLQLFTLSDTHIGSPFTHLSIKTDDDCILMHGVQGAGTDLDGILVYDTCNDVVSLEIPTGDQTRPQIIPNSNCNDARVYLIQQTSPASLPQFVKVYDTNFNVLNTLSPLAGTAITSSRTILPQDNDQVIWVLDAVGALGGTQIYQVDLATNTVIGTPIVIQAQNPSGNSFSAGYIFRRGPCKNQIYSIPSGWISSTLIGAN